MSMNGNGSENVNHNSKTYWKNGATAIARQRAFLPPFIAMDKRRPGCAAGSAHLSKKEKLHIPFRVLKGE